MEQRDSFGNELPPEGVPFSVAVLGKPIGFAVRIETNVGPHTFKWMPNEVGVWECTVEFQCDHCNEVHFQRQASLDAHHPAEACGQLESLACRCWVAGMAAEQHLLEEATLKDGEELLDMSDEAFAKWLASFAEGDQN